VQLPVVLIFRIAKTFTFHVGPQVSYLVVGKMKEDFNGEVQTIDRKDAFINFDVAGVAGFGLEFKPVNFTLRYQYGFTNVVKDNIAFRNNVLTGSEFRNSVLSLDIGLEF